MRESSFSNALYVFSKLKFLLYHKEMHVIVKKKIRNQVNKNLNHC